MKKLLCLLILMVSPMLASAQTVLDVQNSGCLNETRGEEEQSIPTIILTKEGSTLFVQLLNYESNCATQDFNVTSSIYGESGIYWGSVIVDPVLPEIITTCLCPFNVSFTIHDLEPNSFYLECWWYKGQVELTEGEPMVMAFINDICYNILSSTNEAEVIKCANSFTGNIELPENVVYNGTEYRVTSIKESAFSGCSGLTSVTIPNSVKTIGDYAFQVCKGLISVNLSDSLQSIGLSAFHGCTSLTSINIPNNVTTIRDNAFYGCQKLTTASIGSSVTAIGIYAFSDCNSLKSIIIPNSVKAIGSYAFRNCSRLTSITIPNSVTEIGKALFYGCSGLQNIFVEEGNTVYDSRENCFAIIKTSNNELVAGCKSTIIPNDVSAIGNYAFYGCTGLRTVTIPNGVTSIGSAAFAECTGLRSITIPNSVTEICDAAFWKCRSLGSITIPNSVTIIEGQTFAGCQRLTSAIIPNSVVTIEGRAFSGCEGLTSITIPNSVTSIGSCSFAGCRSLASITLSNCLTTIGNGAFENCGLTSITIPNSVTEISVDAFRGCNGLTSVILSDSITTINNDAFHSCSALTSVIIPNSVTIIGGCAFQDCSSLTSITIPNSVTEINSWTFYGCSAIASVTIGNKVDSIGYGAFVGCNKLSDVYCYAENVPKTKNNTFEDVNIGEVTLHVPAASLSAYQAAGPWMNFKEIVALSAQNDQEEPDDYIPFVDMGKQWNVVCTVVNPNSSCHFERYGISEEIERDGKTYFRVLQSEDNLTVMHDAGLYREENRRVYKYDEMAGRDVMLYDFSLKKGDTFTYEMGVDNPVNCKVLKLGWLDDGPIIESLNNSTDTLYRHRYLRTWTIGRDNGSGKYDEIATWVECVGALENMFSPLFASGKRSRLAYIDYRHDMGGENAYLPFSLCDIYDVRGQIHGCNMPTGAADNMESEDWHHRLTYELEGNRLHVYGKIFCCCAGSHYIYFFEEQTDDPLVHKLHFEIRNLADAMACQAHHPTDFYVSGFDPNLNYIVVDDQGVEHPVINKTPQNEYRPFVEEGKVWKVGTGTTIVDNSVQVVDYYYFDGDTIIGGKTCKQMMCQRYVSPNYSNEYWTPRPSLTKVGAWYEEDKKVYSFDERQQTMTLKYDFSLEANDTLHFLNVDDFPPFIIGPKQTGGIEGFKGVYRDIMMCRDEGQNIRNTTWLEGVGVRDAPFRNAYDPRADLAPEFLMSCTVGDEIIYLNDRYEDGATPESMGARKNRFDFTHTIKTKPKARKRSGEEPLLYGEYNDLKLGINLNPLDDAYQVRITDDSGKVVYEKAINAGNIVGLNIDISAYAKGCYTVTVENSDESFTGEFEAQATGIEAIINNKVETRNVIYNLQGQRLSSLQKGLNIVNGQKIYVK